MNTNGVAVKTGILFMSFDRQSNTIVNRTDYKITPQQLMQCVTGFWTGIMSNGPLTPGTISMKITVIIILFPSTLTNNNISLFSCECANVQNYMVSD